MQKIRYSFLFVIGLVLTLGLSTAFAHGGDDKNKRPKNTGTLTVKTSPVAYPVKINGEQRGMSGVNEPAEFYLAPGVYLVEVEGPKGQKFSREIEIRKDAKHCICLKIVEQTISRPCPYDFRLDGPDKVLEGDLVTFAAINAVTGAPVPVKFAWRVSPDTVRVTSGLGTPAITVDSKGMGGQTIRAELDVNDGVYDEKCRQVISVPTEVERPPVPQPFRCDEFEAKSADEDKARFDNCVIQVQNSPDAQLYIIIYPGTDKASTTRNTYDRLSKRTLDYMVKTRRVDPRRISIVRGGSRVKTTYEIWVVPPGAQPPVVR